MPVHVNNPWFEVKELQVIDEIKKALGRQKCAIGLVAGISAFVVLLKTTAVPSVTLLSLFKILDLLINYLRPFPWHWRHRKT